MGLISAALDDIKKTIDLAVLSGVPQPIYIQPLMLGRRHDYFKNGVCFEVARRNKRADILAAGGRYVYSADSELIIVSWSRRHRYDTLISEFTPPLSKGEALCAFGLQIALERITTSLAAFQASSTQLMKDHRSHGFWSARRCDVYIVSLQAGYLQERLELASMLWKNGFSADLMYETGITDVNLEALTELCSREGILCASLMAVVFPLY